jgi:hypothetical protein
MDHRFGAWAQLLAVFRVVYDGSKHPQFGVPARKGYLFDPQRFPFLEGTTGANEIPLVADGVIYRVLEKLLLLDGERLSYRTLDVEEIGSVYQTIMGFGVEIADGTAIALKGKRKNGGVPAAPVISLDALLAVKTSERVKWLKERADTDLTGDADKKLKSAESVADLLAALDKRIDRGATPSPVPRGGLVLQPTDERRRSGSHYTPRSFTEPIVRKTMEPILNRLGRHPEPEAILALKVCDIAVGSGAFLVETCRQLADELISSWHYHHSVPVIPPDEDEILFARRLVAQHCLYGVDRNPMAVDLAKLSLWLATLAKDHPFTFVDHAIRCGDSLVGLTRRQIEDFTWGPATGQRLLFAEDVRKRTTAALRERQSLLAAGDDFISQQLKLNRLEKADENLDLVRFIGDTAVAAFFAAEKDKDREAKRMELAGRIADYLGKGDLNQRPTDEVKVLRGGKFPVTPFHWEIEYPEVFDRDNPGFDGIVGNPPFVGGKRISGTCGKPYALWIVNLHEESNGNADLVAHFFRRSFGLLRMAGAFGLIGTKTIRQGDTRRGGLRWIARHEGKIFDARRRVMWPGVASVVVSSVCVSKGPTTLTRTLDGKIVAKITAFLFHDGGDEDPAVLTKNVGGSYIGCDIKGQGFLFDDNDPEASPKSEMQRVLSARPSSVKRILPYIGGEEINSDPSQQHHRWVISFDDAPEDEARRWPELMEIVERKVKPERLAKADKDLASWPWWQFWRTRKELYQRCVGLEEVAVVAQTGNALAFTFIRLPIIFSHTVVVFPNCSRNFFALLQSRVHQAWALFFAATMKDDARYIPKDCFETFPFAAGFETNMMLEAAGREYYEARAALMQDLWLGLTEIYNLFHSPDDEALARLEVLYRKRAANRDWVTAEGVPAERLPLATYVTPAAALVGVQYLRELHAAMDAAVLTAYGWTDILPKCTCQFLLDYQEEEGDAEESSGRKKKKPWRYRWPDEVRDEVLARLLKLNAERAEEERLAGEVAASLAEKHSKVGRKGKKFTSRPPEGDLLDL